MNYKDFLFKKGITNSPEKSLYMKKGDETIDLGLLMEEFASESKQAIVFMSYVPKPFHKGMETGYIVGATYYPLTGLVPRVMDRKYAVETLNGPMPVNEGDVLLMNDEGKIVSVSTKK